LRFDCGEITLRPTSRSARAFRAADVRGTTRTDFILETESRAAEDTLLDRALISASAKAYAEFVSRLEAPAKPNEQLRRTMQAPLPWQVD
jgi:uncharacterized protein (DUF1778 family)